MGWLRLEERPAGRLPDDRDLGPRVTSVKQAQADSLLRDCVRRAIAP
jgi:hypothetical protein